MAVQSRGSGPETLPAHCFGIEGLQGVFSPSSREVRQCSFPRQCPCLLRSLCWVSSLGLAPVLRLEEKQHQRAGSAEEVSHGDESCSLVTPLAELSEQPVLEAKRLQPRAWTSLEQGQGEQEAVRQQESLGS